MIIKVSKMNRQEFIGKLKEFGLPESEFIILSGGSLLLRGLREETADFDLSASQELARRLDLMNCPKDEAGWYAPFADVQMKTGMEGRDFDVIDGYQCQTLEDILALKRRLMRPKDIKDIETIEEYLRIGIEEVPAGDTAGFWEKHIKYLADDGIIDSSDEEDMEYYTGSEYRGILEANMRRDKDRHHLIYFVQNGSRAGAASYCIFHDEDGKCYLMNFWVFPEYRGSGMGHRCFKALDEYVKADGAKYYEINSTKEDSVRFWKSLGFEGAGTDEYGIPLYVRR